MESVRLIGPKDRYNHSGDAELDEYELGKLARYKIQKVWYWYKSGAYEGSGEMIALGEDGSWTYHCLSHCSCYGPIEYFKKSSFSTLEELTSTFSEELLEQVSVIIEETKMEYILGESEQDSLKAKDLKVGDYFCHNKERVINPSEVFRVLNNSFGLVKWDREYTLLVVCLSDGEIMETSKEAVVYPLDGTIELKRV